MQFKTIFIITVLTSRMVMPGMPDLSRFMGGKASSIGAPTRSLKMDLTSNKSVNAQSKAQCAVPAGMKLGPKVDLEIDLPVREQPTVDNGASDNGSVQKTKFIIKTYWDCGETVATGQPRVLDSEKMMSSLSAADKARMQGMMSRSAMKMHTWSANESHAYWPGKDPKKITDDANTPGLYELTTNYCGGTSITFDPAQDFLAPIEVSSPGKDAVDLAQPIKIEWKSVPNAKAYVLSAFAGKDHEMVMWTSSAQPDATTDFISTPLSNAEITKYIEKGILLPPTKTSCRIPAGIFKDVGTPMLTITAIGVDKTQEKDTIRTVVTVRSTATVMGAMGGNENQVQEPPADDTEAQPATNDTSSTDQDANKNKRKNPLGKLGDIFRR
jgi:hypothetical protein